MAKTESPRAESVRPLTVAAIPADLPPVEPPESLDKVRDILFGSRSG